MTFDERVRRFERRCLQRILRKAEGVVVVAARIAGRNRTAFHALLRAHGLNPHVFRTPADDAARKDRPLYLHLQGDV